LDCNATQASGVILHMTRENKTWYVEQWGELLAGEFLLELGAVSVAAPTVDIGFDYLAFFKGDNTVAIIAVEVKITQKEIKRRYAIPSQVLHRLQRVNVPGLIIVVDVRGCINKLLHLSNTCANYAGTGSAGAA
jgi:hypothetical protein